MIDRNTPEEELIAQLAGELEYRDTSGERFALTLRASEALALLGYLQLALNHPLNNGEPAKLARAIADVLGTLLSRTSACAEVIRRGWDLHYRRERGRPELVKHDPPN